MNPATICLGSNTSDAASHINRAVGFLSTLARIVNDSGAYPSDPEKSVSTAIYTNRLLEITTELDYETLHGKCKEYESGVRATVRQPDRVTVDIDIVVFNNEILRPVDYSSAYYRKGLLRLCQTANTLL